MPPPKGDYFYRNLSEEELWIKIKKDPKEIFYILGKDQTPDMQLFCAKWDPNLIIHMTEPSPQLIFYITHERPKNTMDLHQEKVTVEDWGFAILQEPLVMKDYLWNREETDSFEAPFKLWVHYIVGALKNRFTKDKHGLLLGKFFRKDKLDSIPLCIVWGICHISDETGEEYFPEYNSVFKKFKNELNTQIFKELMNYKNVDKKIKALIKLYKD